MKEEVVNNKLVLNDDEEEKPVSLKTSNEELVKRIISEDNLDNLNNIVSVFNINIKKKDILRAGKLSELQDVVVEQISERLDKHADEFSNKDLLDYFKTVQDTINKTDVSLTTQDSPSIQINQNQLNINVGEDTLSRDSRDKVANAVQSILAKINKEEPIIEQPEENKTIIIDVDEKEVKAKSKKKKIKED